MADSILQTTAFEGYGIRAQYPKELVSNLYAEDNNNLCALEPSASGNDVIVGFNNYSSNGTGQFVFDNSMPFISQMFVQFQLTMVPGATNAANAITANTQFLAYHFIEYIKYTVGGVQTQTIYGEQIVDYLNEIIKNEEKARQIFSLAGGRILQKIISQIPTASTTSTMLVHAFLPLPWCDPNGIKIGENTKPFPLYRINGNVNVQIKLRNFSNCITLGGNSYVGDTAGSVKLSGANLFYKYHKVSNIQLEKKIGFSYPCKNIAQFNTFALQTPIQGYAAGSTLASSFNSVKLTGFPQGQCTDIILRAVVNNYGGTAYNDVYYGEIMSNLLLRFNGKIIFQSNNAQDRMWDVLSTNKRAIHQKQLFRLNNKLSGTVDSGTANTSYPVIGNFPLIKESFNSNYVETIYPASLLQTNLVTPAVQAPTTSIVLEAYDIGDAATWRPTDDATNWLGPADQRSYYYVIPIAETRLSELHQLGEFSLGANFQSQTLDLQFSLPCTKINDGGGNNTQVNLYVTYVMNGLYYFNENREVTYSS